MINETLEHKEISDLFSSMQQAIFRQRPILNKIFEQNKARSVFDYASSFNNIKPTPRLDARRQQLIESARGLIAKRLGTGVADAVAGQLSRTPLVSTADHHGPIHHPFFVNSNIISALAHMAEPRPERNHLVVFSFASVSLNNSSYPRGIEFNSRSDGTGKTIRLPLWPDKLKMGVGYTMRSYTLEDIARASGEIDKHLRSGELDARRGEQVKNYLQTHFTDEEVLGSPNFVEQMTRLNYRIWPTFFKDIGDIRVPDLVYLDIESLVSELLLERHLGDSSSLLRQFMFDPKLRCLHLQLFEGLGGAFSQTLNWGTFDFWAVNESGRRVRLMPEGNWLVSPDGAIRHELAPEAIREALIERKIFPAMYICYLMVALYYGKKCLGGFSQIHDLTRVKESWIKLLKELGLPAEAEAIAPIQTDQLGGDGMVLSYHRCPDGSVKPASGIDMALAEENSGFERYVRLARAVTMPETMAPLMPDIYAVLYSQKDRHPDFTKLSSHHIIDATGLKDKILKAG